MREEHGLQNQSPGYLYATSLHWTCSQQGVGQTNIEAGRGIRDLSGVIQPLLRYLRDTCGNWYPLGHLEFVAFFMVVVLLVV